MNSSDGKFIICLLLASVWINSHEVYSQSITKIDKLITKCEGGETNACIKLLSIAKNHSDPQSQCQAIQGITDQITLIDIVKQTNNQQVLLTALEKITDQPFLIRFTSEHINEAGLYALRNINDPEQSKILLSKFIKRYDSFKDTLKEIKYEDFFHLDTDPKIWAYEPVFKKYYKKLIIDVNIKEYVRTYFSNQDNRGTKIQFKDYKLIIKDGNQVLFSHEYLSRPPDFTSSLGTVNRDPLYWDGGFNDIVTVILSKIPANDIRYVYENLVSRNLREILRSSSFDTTNILKETFSTTYSHPLVAEGLISYYTFDYKSKDTDYQYMYNGRSNGFTSTDIPGESGYSMQFYYNLFSIPHAFFSNNSLDWSFSIWIKTGSNNFIIYCQDDLQKSNYISINSSNKLEIQDTVKGAFTNDLSEKLLNNNWHMLTITSSCIKKVFTYYIDGQLQETMIGSWNGSGNTSIIGSNVTYDDHLFVGKMDNIRFYNRILKQEEIIQIYNAKQ